MRMAGREGREEGGEMYFYDCVYECDSKDINLHYRVRSSMSLSMIHGPRCPERSSAWS